MRLVLASSSPQRRAILDGSGRGVRRPARRRGGADEGAAGDGRAARTRCARRSRWRAAEDECVLGVDTLVATDARDLGQAAPTPTPRAETLRRAVGPHPRGGQRLRAGRRRRRRRGRGDHPRDLPRARRRHRSPGTSPRASGRAAPAATRSRAAAARWSPHRGRLPQRGRPAGRRAARRGPARGARLTGAADPQQSRRFPARLQRRGVRSAVGTLVPRGRRPDRP